MSDFLLELLSEEIPARMQDKARADLARLFGEQLEEAGLKAAAVTPPSWRPSNSRIDCDRGFARSYRVATPLSDPTSARAGFVSGRVTARARTPAGCDQLVRTFRVESQT